MERIIPINSLLLSLNNPQMNQRTNLKLKNIILFNFALLIIISLSLIFYYFHSFSKNNIVKLENYEYLIDENNIKTDFSYITNYSQNKENLSIYKKNNNIKNSNLKSFSSPGFYQITKEKYLYEVQKQSIYTNLITNKFSGTWGPINKNNSKEEEKLIFNIGDSNKGDILIKFDKVYEIRSRAEAIELFMKNNEGKYNDHWIKLTSYSLYDSLEFKVNKLKQTFHINGKFVSNFEKGEIFKTTYKRENRCSTIINMTFPLIYEKANATLITGEIVTIGIIPTINPEKINIILNSTCGFQYEVEGKALNENEERKQKLSKLKKYFFISLFSSILYSIGAIFLIYGLKKNEMAVSSINMEFIISISVWNFYGFSSNIYFAFKGFIDFFLNFAIIGFCFLVKFILFDSLIFYVFWGIKERTITSECLLAKLKIRFYSFMIIIYILSFFLIPNFYINFFYILFFCLFLWIPQIIHNIISNNRYGFPFIYIFGCTIDRIIYPFYFRVYEDNFLLLKTNNNTFFIILIIFIAFTIIFLYLQTFLGPRFVLSEKYQQFPYCFYKNKEELPNNYKDINNEECVICLMPIFDEEKEKGNIIKEMKEFTSKDLENEEKKNVDNSKNNNEGNSQNTTFDNSQEINEKINDIDLNDLNESKNDGSLLLKEEELDNNDDNNKLIIKNEKDNEKKENIIKDENKKKETNNHFVKNKNISNFKIALFKIAFFFKIFYKKNIFFYYKSPANVHNKLYMLTPCKHIFHSECLEQWLEQKKECPNCRTSFENLI